MSSTEEGHPIMSEGNTLQRVRTRRTRIILIGVLAAVLVVAAVGICAATFSHNSPRREATLLARNMDNVNLESMSDNEQDREEDEESLARKVRDAYTGTPAPVTPQNGRVATNPRITHQVSCSSTSSSDTIAAAHIKGHGTRAFKMSTRDTNALSYLPPGYQQNWQCSEYIDVDMPKKHAHAFVDGGMWFNQTDKSLYVPTCGYYYVYSQITFKCHPSLTASKSVYHNFKFERNCPDWQDAITPVVQGTSTIGPFRDSTQAGRATTHTGDIVKLCQGGRMWVEIPDGNNGVPCPPYGDDESTFIGAVLIANTTCHWPPQMTLTNMQHS